MKIKEPTLYALVVTLLCGFLFWESHCFTVPDPDFDSKTFFLGLTLCSGAISVFIHFATKEGK